nr:hypothetical protein GCM10020093_028130 [Planobispora longispora]
MMELNLGGGFFPEPVPRDLGPYAQWFVNEDNRMRRLVDQDGPSGTEPAPSVGAPGCTVVLGQFGSNKPLFGNRHEGFRPWQVLCLIDPGGVVRPTVREPGRSWLHQVVLHKGRWFTASSAGLEADTADGRTTLVMPRPRAGALRWFPAGNHIYAISADQVSPARGWSVGVFNERTHAVDFLMGKQSATLSGHLTSRHRWERPRMVADGDSMWMTMRDAGRSRLLHVTPGARGRCTAPRGRSSRSPGSPRACCACTTPTTRPATSATSPPPWCTCRSDGPRRAVSGDTPGQNPPSPASPA